MKTKNLGSVKKMGTVPFDWEEVKTNFTIETDGVGTQNEPLTALNIFARYSDELADGSKEQQTIKFEIPLTPEETEELIKKLKLVNCFEG